MLSVSVNSVPLWLIIVAGKSILAVYGNRTTEAQRHRGRTNGDAYCQEAITLFIGNLDLEFRLLAKNAICNRMNRLL